MKADQFGKFARYDGKCQHRPDLPCDLFLLSWTQTPAVNVRAYAAEPNRQLAVEMKNSNARTASTASRTCYTSITWKRRDYWKRRWP